MNHMGTGEEPPNPPAGTRILYVALRGIDLALCAAAPPLALGYLLGGGEEVVIPLRLLFWLVFTFYVLTAVALAQASYPTGTFGALTLTGGTLVTTGLLAATTPHGLLSAATMLVLCQFVAFGLIFTWFAVRIRLGSKGGNKGPEWLAFWIALPLGLVSLFYAFFLAQGMVQEIQAIASGLERAASIAALVYEVGSVMAHWYRNSVFSRFLQTEEYARRQRVFERWSAPTAIGVIVSACASLAVVFWYS